MLLHIAGLPQKPAVQVGLLSRTGSPQVQLPATQTSSSHISPVSGPLFTEDRLNTSGSNQEMCDQEFTTLTQDRTPTRIPVHNAPSQTGSIATVDYSTQGDPDQPAHSPLGSSGNQSNSIDNTRNFLLPEGLNFMMTYLDDIIIFSNSKEGHLIHLEEVFCWLREAGLKMK